MPPDQQLQQNISKCLLGINSVIGHLAHLTTALYNSLQLCVERLSVTWLVF